jgi:hypothetical protein
MSTINKKELLAVIAVMLLLLIAGALFSGCMTPQRAERKLEKLLLKQPMEVAEFTRDKFPCITTHETKDTTFFKTDSVVSYVEVPCPQTFAANKFYEPTPRANVVYVKVPIKSASSKEVIHDKIFVEDSSKIFIANKLLSKANEDLKAMESSRNFWRKWCLIFGGVLLLIVIIFAAKIFAKISLPKLPI